MTEHSHDQDTTPPASPRGETLIPEGVVYCRVADVARLDARAAFVIEYLRRNIEARATGFVDLSYSEIAEGIGLSKHQVRRSVAKLIEAGDITATQTPPNRNRYSLADR